MILDIVNAGKLILPLNFIDRLPLLGNMYLVLVGLISNILKQQLDVCVVAGAGFHVGRGLSGVDPVCYNLLFINLSLPLFAQVTLVTYEQDRHCWLFFFAGTLIIVISIDDAFLEVVPPYIYTFIAINIGNIKNDNATVGPSIKAIT